MVNGLSKVTLLFTLHPSLHRKKKSNIQAVNVNTDVKARLEPRILILRSFVTKFISELAPTESPQSEKNIFSSHLF